MAALRRGLAAQEHGWDSEEVPVQRHFDPALPHEGREVLFVTRPSYDALPVRLEHLPGRGELGFVEILRAAEFLQKEREVGAPGEAGELGGVVQPDVEEALDPGSLQSPEELGRRLPRKTDRIDFRGLTSASGNRTGWTPGSSPSV